MSIGAEQTVPVLRIFSIEKAREFYVGFPGVTWDCEHRHLPFAECR